MATRIIAKIDGKEEHFHTNQEFEWLCTILDKPETQLIQVQNRNNRWVLLSKSAILLVSEDE